MAEKYIIKINEVKTAKRIYGLTPEEREIIVEAMKIAGKQYFQQEPKNKDEMKNRILKNGGEVEELNKNQILFKRVFFIDSSIEEKEYIIDKHLFGI